MFDECSFYNQFIYNVGVLRTLHINGPNWFDNDLQNTTQKTEDSEIFQERVEDIKEAIKTHKSKDRQHNGQNKRKWTKGQTTIYKTLRRKLKIRKYFKKGLKISKRQSKPVDRRRTDNTMNNRKEKGQTIQWTKEKKDEETNNC